MQVSIRLSAIISIGLFVVLFFSSNLLFYAILGIVLFVFFGIKFFFELGNKIEIRDVMILFACLQWLIGPILSYAFIEGDSIFHMSVDQKTYLSFVFPATFLFSVGLYLPIWKKSVSEDIILAKIKGVVNQYPNLDLLFIGIGFVLSESASLFPRFLMFFIFLMGNLRFVGLYFLVLRNRPFKWYIFGFVILSFAAVGVKHAMFHNLLLWFVFLIIIISFIYKFSILKKIIFVLIFSLLVLSIQIVKGQFRSLDHSDRTFGEFYEMASENLNDENKLFSDAFIDYNITRINQGWIIARIMYYTPAFEPFAEGETIWKGLKASLLPRFLIPDLKSFAGASEYFERFTGQALAAGTSMDLSIIGEAYANYGVNGGIVFMFFLGLFYNFILFQIFKISINNPSLLFMLPLMFLHVVKAETDFSTTINFLVKAIFVVIGIFWLFRKFFGMKI